MTTKEIYRKYVTRENPNPPKIGGQSCGLPKPIVKLNCEEFDISIEIGFYRSQIKNHELAETLMMITLDELNKT